MTYAIGRGYKSIALRRDWDDIDPMLRAGYAHVVVVAREEHGVDKGGEVSGATVTDLDRYREGVNTRPLVPPTQDMTSTADRVRRILDGDEPAPDEVAPETVAALRLLWWRLRNRS